MITYTISICDQLTSIIFDMRYAYYFASVQFTMRLNLVCDVLNYIIYISTLVSESVVITHVHYSCHVLFMHFQTQVDWIILDMLDFNVILGMTWSSLYYDVLNCNAKTVTLSMTKIDKLGWNGVYKAKPVRII